MEVLISRVLLRSPDPVRLQRFYRDQLQPRGGPRVSRRDRLHAGSGFIEVLRTHVGRTGRHVRGRQLWLQVRDIASTEKQLRDAGVTVTREPVTEPWGLIEMHIADPDGRTLIVVEIPRTIAAPRPADVAEYPVMTD